MARTVGIGHQDFEKLRMKNNFYVDKTAFIREWWESDDDVTLIEVICLRGSRSSSGYSASFLLISPNKVLGVLSTSLTAF